MRGREGCPLFAGGSFFVRMRGLSAGGSFLCGGVGREESREAVF